MKTVSPQEAVENLCNAIIVQASRDLKDQLENLYRNPNDKSALHEVESLQKFFLGPWYEQLTDVDGQWLFQSLCEKYREEFEEKEEKKKRKAEEARRKRLGLS
ncbi:MAG: hypothetical protein LIO94_04910 [Clostridiales bacterium]|nr:hypothetical protein [Clostridiales bacterium]